MKQPLSKKTSVLLPAVKARLEAALSDMKKSVVNVKKSPWMLSRSSSYLVVVRARTVMVLGCWVLPSIHQYWVVLGMGDISGARAVMLYKPWGGNVPS